MIASGFVRLSGVLASLVGAAEDAAELVQVHAMLLAHPVRRQLPFPAGRSAGRFERKRLDHRAKLIERLEDGLVRLVREPIPTALCTGCVDDGNYEAFLRVEVALRPAHALDVEPDAPASAAGAAASASAPVSLWALTGFFLKVGSVLFGSGYVLLAFLRGDLVQRWGWLTDQQLMDAIAVGQFTPGPVFTTATFIGYVVAGFPGALLATLGIFLPSFVFVAASSPLIPRIRRSAWAGRFLDGVNVASLGLMATVTWQLGRAALIDWITVGTALVATILVFRLRLNSAWLVLGGAFIGLGAHLLR